MSGTGLLRFILVVLPLTNSVTLPVGFPLKLYEVAGFLAVAHALLGRGFALGRAGRVVALWGAFWFGSTLASAWGLYELSLRDLGMLEWAHGRYDPLINTLYHYTYLAFDIGLLALFLDALVSERISRYQFCRWWLTGTALAVGYAVVLNLVHHAGLPTLLVLRWDDVQLMNVGGIPVVRTGPFEEGNYFGLYLLASLVVALWARRRWPERFIRAMAPVILLGVVITASPAALLGAVALVLVAVFFGGGSPLARGAAVGAGALGLAFLAVTGLLQTLVLDKFSLLFYGGVADVRNISLVQRLNESHHAWQLFLDHPQGVGMGNFGYFFGDHANLYVWLRPLWMQFKHIPNNVYLEVLSEHGIVVALLFAGILVRKVVRLVRAREYLVTTGVLLMYVYFAAFPTFRLALIWVFWAFVLHLGSDRESAGDEGPSAS
ncbi:MAG: hypothetical protein GY838_07785 [bacterium]|nr:hypothetical protein [bacterium]